jgi:hypothetical protein
MTTRSPIFTSYKDSPVLRGGVATLQATADRREHSCAPLTGAVMA